MIKLYYISKRIYRNIKVTGSDDFESTEREIFLGSPALMKCDFKRMQRHSDLLGGIKEVIGILITWKEQKLGKQSYL